MAGDPLPHDPHAALAQEVARSRRYGHPLTLIGIVPVQEGAEAEVRRRIRTVDRAWVTHEAILVLLPESDAAEGRALAGRLRAASPLLARAAMRVASFPADALTTEALLDAACGRAAPRLDDSPAVPRTSHSTIPVPSP